MYTSLQYKQALDSLIALKDELLCSIGHCTTQKINGIVGIFNPRGIVQVVGDLQLMLDGGVDMTKEQAEKTISICKKLIDLYETNQLAKQGIKPQPSIINIDGIQITAPHYVIDKPTNASLVRYVKPVESLLESLKSKGETKEQAKYRHTKEKIESVLEKAYKEGYIVKKANLFEWQKQAVQLDFFLGVLLCKDEGYIDRNGQEHWEIIGDLPIDALTKLFPKSKNIGQQRANRKSMMGKNQAKPPKEWEFLQDIAKSII